MPIITNSGKLNYTIGTQTSEVISNTVSTNLDVTYSAVMTKTSYAEEFVPGDVLTYQIHITNTGTGTLYDLTVADDLGTVPAGTPISYVDGSATAYLHDSGGTVVAALPMLVTATETTLTFKITGTIPQNNHLVITYRAAVKPDLDATVVSITNEATFTAHEGGLIGELLSITADETVNRETVTIVKTASSAQAVPGDILTYTFSLTNIGTTDATVNTIVDQLPANFNIENTITALIGSTSVTYVKDTDYTVTVGNLLTIDPDAASTPLTVPQATAGVAGVTTVTIKGTITA